MRLNCRQRHSYYKYHAPQTDRKLDSPMRMNNHEATLLNKHDSNCTLKIRHMRAESSVLHRLSELLRHFLGSLWSHNNTKITLHNPFKSSECLPMCCFINAVLFSIIYSHPLQCHWFMVCICKERTGFLYGDSPERLQITWRPSCVFTRTQWPSAKQKTSRTKCVCIAASVSLLSPSTVSQASFHG